ESPLKRHSSASFKAVITPESLVQAFLEQASGMRLEFLTDSQIHKKDAELCLFKGDSKIAQVTFDYGVRAFEEHLLKEEGKTVYDIEKWQEEEYFNLNDLAGFLLGIYDKIGEDTLKDVINDYLHEFFGDGVDLDIIRNWYDNGIFGWFSSADELKQALSDDPLVLNEYGYPTGIREYTYEYPDVGKDYYYSYAELADYCTLAAYRGREFVWPEPVEATPEQLAAAKEDFLKLYRNKYKVDQHEAEVEWGDEVYIDILPYLYGFPVKAYFFENSYAKIGDEMYGPGLDEKLLGMKVGEVRDVTATLTGEQYGDFEGMEVDFEITLITIDRNVEPSWTEEFVCGRLGYESLAACEDMLKKELTVEAEVTDEEILEKISREAKAMTEYDELPRLMQLKLWNRRYNIAYRDTMNFFGMTPEAQYVATFNDLKTTSDPTVRGYYKMMDQGLERSIQEHSFYAAVAAKEELKLTGSELLDAVDAKMTEYHCSSFEELMKKISLEEITDSAIERKADAIMLETAVIKR
ncbi:MAG: hypothetical protein K6G81_08985, partial [Lachnospiraceae bacterium]|nr:hypothetical protein [Lachnospiraceae bacterium]